MEKSYIEETVLGLARRIAANHGVEVVGANIFGHGRRRLLRVFIDKSDGVTLDDCARFSAGLGTLLDESDIMDGPYNLEVSSPGLDRPLTRAADFERNTGRLVRVVTADKIDDQSFFVGRVIGVSGDVIRLSMGKKEVDIPLEKISKAKLEIEIK